MGLRTKDPVWPHSKNRVRSLTIPEDATQPRSPRRLSTTPPPRPPPRERRPRPESRPSLALYNVRGSPARSRREASERQRCAWYRPPWTPPKDPGAKRTRRPNSAPSLTPPPRFPAPTPQKHVWDGPPRDGPLPYGTAGTEDPGEKDFRQRGEGVAGARAKDLRQVRIGGLPGPRSCTRERSSAVDPGRVPASCRAHIPPLPCGSTTLSLASPPRNGYPGVNPTLPLP